VETALPGERSTGFEKENRRPSVVLTQVLVRGAFGGEPTRDPINDEIHKHREEHARKFNFDLGAICKDLKERPRNLKVVRLPAKKIISKKTL
jgi:hypothetical protein